MPKLTWGERLWAAVDRTGSKPSTKTIPAEYTGGRPREYDHEIVSGITNQVIGWETPDGESVMKARGTHFHKSAHAEHLDAMAEYTQGRFTAPPDNSNIAHVGSSGILWHCQACGQNYTGEHRCE